MGKAVEMGRYLKYYEIFNVKNRPSRVSVLL